MGVLVRNMRPECQPGSDDGRLPLIGQGQIVYEGVTEIGAPFEPGVVGPHASEKQPQDGDACARLEQRRHGRRRGSGDRARSTICSAPGAIPDSCLPVAAYAPLCRCQGGFLLTWLRFCRLALPLWPPVLRFLFYRWRRD